MDKTMSVRIDQDRFDALQREVGAGKGKMSLLVRTLLEKWILERQKSRDGEGANASPAVPSEVERRTLELLHTVLSHLGDDSQDHAAAAAALRQGSTSDSLEEMRGAEPPVSGPELEGLNIIFAMFRSLDRAAASIRDIGEQLQFTGFDCSTTDGRRIHEYVRNHYLAQWPELHVSRDRWRDGSETSVAQYEAMTIEWRRDMADAEFGIDMAPPAFARIAKARRLGELEDF